MDNKRERSDFQDWRRANACGGLAVMNGYRSEQEEQSSTVGQICCLVEDNDRCKRPAGNASYSKRIQKTVSQRKLKLSLDVNVSISEIFLRLNPFTDPMLPTKLSI